MTWCTNPNARRPRRRTALLLALFLTTLILYLAPIAQAVGASGDDHGFTAPDDCYVDPVPDARDHPDLGPERQPPVGAEQNSPADDPPTSSAPGADGLPVGAAQPRASPGLDSPDTCRADSCGDEDCDPGADEPPSTGSGEVPVPPGVPGQPGVVTFPDDPQPADALDELSRSLIFGPEAPDGADAPDRSDENSATASASTAGPAPGDQHSNVAIPVAAGAITFAALLRVFGRQLLAGVGLAGAHLARLVVPLGYRLQGEALLEHPVRRAIVQYLQAHPGATLAELTEICRVGYGRVTYHITILLREEVLRERAIDGRKRFFPFAAPRVDEDQVRVRALLAPKKPARRILDLVARAPGTSTSQIARALGMSPGHAHYHLERLKQHGLMSAKRHGRRLRHYLTGDGQERVASAPAPVDAT